MKLVISISLVSLALFMISGPGLAFEYGENVKEHFNFGYEFYLRGSWHEALLEFTNVALLTPEAPLGPLWCALCHQKLGEREKAVKCLKVVLAIEPKNAQARQVLEEIGVDLPVEEPPPGTDLENPFPELEASLPDQDQTPESAGEGERGVLDGRTGSDDEELTSEVWAVMRDYLYGGDTQAGEETSGPVTEDHTLLSPEDEFPEVQTALVEEEPVEGPWETEEPLRISEEDLYRDHDTCEEYRRLVTEALVLFNIDHIDPMTTDIFSLEKLVEDKYLDFLPVCPSDGVYSMTGEGEITCNVH